jgi:hypothetical protein
MTRTQLVTKALEIVGDASLTSEAAGWVDDVLYEIETMGYWKFLEKEVTHVTGSSQSEIALASISSGAITDYSKGISIYNNTSQKELVQVSKSALDAIDDGTTGDIRVFSLWKDTLYFYPTTDSVDTLTIKYFQEITVPTADGDDMETKTGMKPKYQRFVVDGVVSLGFQYVDDNRATFYRELFDRDMGFMAKDNEDYFSAKESAYDKPSMVRFRQPNEEG